MKKCAKIIVKGLVQGVGYRYFCTNLARELNASGYTRNLQNGDVEIEVEIDESDFDKFVSQLRRGPFNAKVSELLIEELVYEGKYDRFEVTY